MIFCLDIGGTYTKYATFKDGELTEKGKWKTEYDFDKLIEKIGHVLSFQPCAITISSGGFWTEDGKSTGYETIPKTADGSFVDTLKNTYKCPVYIDNDAKCALRAELALGSAKDYDNVGLIVLGSSLGCAVAFDKKVQRGSTGQFASMFAMPEIFDGTNYIYDHYANSLKMSENYSVDCKGNFATVADLALQGDKKASEILDKYTQSVALKCLYLVLAYDPQAVLLAGAISQNEFIKNQIVRKYKVLCDNVKKHKKAPIILARFVQDANLLGAALMAQEVNYERYSLCSVKNASRYGIY